MKQIEEAYASGIPVPNQSSYSSIDYSQLATIGVVAPSTTYVTDMFYFGLSGADGGYAFAFNVNIPGITGTFQPVFSGKPINSSISWRCGISNATIMANNQKYVPSNCRQFL